MSRHEEHTIRKDSVNDVAERKKEETVEKRQATE
jgi:hypothetical protein